MKASLILKAVRLIRKNRLTYLSLALVVGLALFAVALAATEVTLGGYTFTFNGVTYNADGTSTWSYTVTPPGTGGPDIKDLSHWVLGLCEPPDDPTVVSSNPAGSKGTDPLTGLYGIKWDQQISKTGDPVDHSFVLDGWYRVVEVDIAMKAGSNEFWGKIDGPSCDTCSGSITIVKEVYSYEGDINYEDDQDFDFTGDLGEFTLDDYTVSDTPKSITFSTLNPGTYVVTETLPTDWDVTGIVCDDDNSSGAGAVATIQLDPCEDVTCTFENAPLTEPTAVTLSSFAARSSAGGFARGLWLGLAGVVLIVGGLFWVKRRAG